tara:strand:- start:1519 stop:2100 length:582 start_codon:yes stop_codon:yes gene_type:complete
MAQIIKNFFSLEELNLLQKYCYNKLDQNKDWKLDGQSFSPAWYFDPLMIALLDLKLPIAEEKSKLKLFPTYAYWRYYVFGGTLASHTDRPSCEISITSCIKKYDNWPILVEGQKFELEEGDAVLYNGLFEKHGRPGTYKGEGMAQVFFHYVNKNGLFSHHAYDKVLKDTEMQETEKDKEIIESIKNGKNSKYR